jgi:CheY-like chemotaxis protein
LKLHRPDVIFMDHMMPGIDGFQALEAIKANPATATIPVMMYTSQEGELYVGQARALGAFGVLPKSLKPIELNEVLKALHLVPAARGEQAARQPSPLAADHRAETPEVAALLEDLFRQQRLALSAEIRESYERAVATREQLPKETLPPPPPPPPRRPTIVRPSVVAVAILGGLAVLFAALYASTTRVLQDTTQRTSNLIASAAQLASANLSANASTAPPVGTASGSAKPLVFGAEAVPPDRQLVEIIEWALNENNTYGFDEVALSEPRAEKLRRAIGYVASAGLGGRLTLRVHVGRFCMTYGSDGRAQLAAAELPVTQCEQVGWLPSDAFALGRRQTLPFANIVMDAQSGTGVRVETASAGDEEPAVPYPAMTADLTAGEWNRVAAANHRIDIRFVGEPIAGAASAAR